ncbi:MAG: hypothetical protein J7M26_07645 [Armatimonadetes bacterium]|nr:hypothetical protein [Armatimonadota bacterium]
MTLLVALIGTLSVAQPALVSWDFEDGTLQGWRVVSGNLGPQPTDAANDRWGDAFGKQGKYFLGTGELPGGKFSDALTGELRSSEFTVQGAALALLVGGGDHPDQTFVALVDAQTGAVLARATGRNQEYMRPVVWDLTPFKGKKVYLRVVDTATGAWGHINVDDVRELTAEQLAEHQRQLARAQADKKRQLLLWQKDLWSPRRKVYRDKSLAKVAFPIGGIGTGTIYLRGNGDLTGWQIFNHVNLHAELPDSFFAVWARAQNEEGVSRALQTEPVGTWRGVEQAEFLGEYPLGLVALSDSKLPVLVGLEAFSPMEPLNARLSAMPAAIFIFRLVNTHTRPVEVSVLASLTNAVGWDGYSEIQGVSNDSFGGNINRLVRVGKNSWAIVMTKEGLGPEDPAAGSMALVALDSGDRPVNCATAWTDLNLLREDFSADGVLKESATSDEAPKAEGKTRTAAAGTSGQGSPPGQTINGAIAVPVRLAPHEVREVAFAICWHFPNRLKEWEPPPKGLRVGNMYTHWYPYGVRDVAEELADNFAELRRVTELFHDRLYSSDLPGWLLEALGVHIATVSSPLIMWLEDGTVCGFEGLRENRGCCPLNCTHVYNYEQTMAFLWPELERRVREIDLSVQQKPDGGVRHRLQIPLDAPRWTEPFTDGHLGTILKAYREVRNCPDLEWLKKWWPRVRKAMEFVLENWDADGNGIIEGPQPNTYDCTDYGPNTFIGTLYLAALRAAEEMALRVGDEPAAERYRQRFEVGRAALDQTCWREEFGYYVQVYDAAKYQHKQWGRGCLADQLLGQWWARLLELGSVLPEKHVHEALRSIYRYNFKTDYTFEPYSHRNHGQDKGLLNCSWPFGGRAVDPINYADGAWTGVEYQVAANMIWEGLVNTGLTVAKGARERYDGVRRNPFDEPECGHHYARPMSSWSLLLALTGVQVDGPAQQLTLRRWPPWPARWLLLAPEGWGTIEILPPGGQVPARLTVRCDQGQMQWTTFRLPQAPGLKHRGLAIELATSQGQTLTATCKAQEGRLVVKLEPSLTLQAGQELSLAVKPAG